MCSQDHSRASLVSTIRNPEGSLVGGCFNSKPVYFSIHAKVSVLYREVGHSWECPLLACHCTMILTPVPQPLLRVPHLIVLTSTRYLLSSYPRTPCMWWVWSYEHWPCKEIQGSDQGVPCGRAGCHTQRLKV